jgi:hypothetical protein
VSRHERNAAWVRLFKTPARPKLPAKRSPPSLEKDHSKSNLFLRSKGIYPRRKAMFFKKKPEPSDGDANKKPADSAASQAGKPEGNPENHMKQPGIIFSALGSKVSSGDLLKRLKQEEK